MSTNINTTTNEATIRPVITTLERLFAELNGRLFEGSLETPVITVSPDTTKGAYGWFTTWRAWTSDDDESVKASTGYFEITCCAEHLQRPIAEVVGTLLHEMVHLYCHMNGIKDTSRQGWYHNQQYKKAAEAHGLIVTKSDKYGWAHTKLDEETSKWLAKRKATEDFGLHRRAVPKKQRKTVKSHSIKYQCPCCGNSVRATKPVSIRCEDCDQIMDIC